MNQTDVSEFRVFVLIMFCAIKQDDMTTNTDSPCRICLANCAVVSIFKRSGISKRKTILEMINILFTFSASQGDGLPDKICKKCRLKVSSAFKLKILAEKTHCKLLAALPSAGKVGNATEHATRRANLQGRNNQLDCGGTRQNGSTNIDTNSTDLDQSFTKHDDGNSAPECYKSINASIFNIGSNLSKFKESSIKLDDEIKYGTEEKFIKIECDNLKIEYDVNTFDRSDGNTETRPTEKIKEEERVSDDLLTESDDENVPLMSMKSKDRCRKRKIAGMEKIQCESSRKKSVSVCEQCGKLVADLSLHRRVHGGERRLLACGDCPKQFTNHSGRSRHRAVHHLGHSYFCQICNKTFKRGADHRRAVHPTRPREVTCAPCGRRFYTRAELARHAACHTRERPFPCPVCHKDFRTLTLCNYHRRSVHEKERTAKCDHCPKAFFNRGELNKHTRCHLALEKNYMCVECGKRFATSSQLKVHEKRHSPLKEFACHICRNAFRTNGALKSHQLTHTKEKTHPCQHCGAKFGRKDHRNNHERSVHQIKTLIAYQL